MSDLPTNLLYFGDNLEWLRQQGKFPDESVDLVYLDPPFNSNQDYNVLFEERDKTRSAALRDGYQCIEPTTPNTGSSIAGSIG